MQFLEEEILEITVSTWSALLELDIHPSRNGLLFDGSVDLVIGQVGIFGGWNGFMVLQGTVGLARSAAAQIFSKDPAAVQEQDQRDAMYELSNILAGNIKSLFPEPCRLSLPTVTQHKDAPTQVPGADPVSELYFECHGEPLRVTLWKLKGPEHQGGEAEE